MTKLLKVLRNTALALTLIMISAQSFAADESKDDETIQEEMSKFSVENEKLRIDHYQEIRDLEIKHINEYYDKKTAFLKESAVMWRQLKPGDKDAQKALRQDIRKRQKAFREEMNKFNKDFKKDVLDAKKKEFRTSMKDRIKGMKNKHKE